MANFLLWAVFSRIGLREYASMNLWVALVNLIPIRKSDGFRILAEVIRLGTAWSVRG